jgi:hypothetical protein
MNHRAAARSQLFVASRCSSFYVSRAQLDAQEALRLLGESGLDLKQLSLIGKDRRCEEHAAGFYTVGGQIKSWSGIDAAGRGVPGVQAALAQIGIPNYQLSKYQRALDADKCVLAVHGRGRSKDGAKMRSLLAKSDSWKSAR